MTNISIVTVPEQGQLVEVRQRRFIVCEVTKSTLPSSILPGGIEQLQHLVSLTSVEDDALGEAIYPRRFDLMIVDEAHNVAPSGRGRYATDQQLELFNRPEREQYNRNIAALRHRLEQIPAEIEQETALIRARFADPEARLFPVAVTFLVPERLGH